MLKWKIQSDGSFGVTGAPVEFFGAYPAIDGMAIRPLRTDVHLNQDGGRIIYHLSTCQVELTLGQADDVLSIRCSLKGCSELPNWVSPIFGARIKNADQFYRLGEGFGGGSGFYDYSSDKHLSSFGLCALIHSSSSTLVIAAREFRKFVCKFVVHSQVEGVIPGALSVNFRTEQIPCPSQEVHLPTIFLRSGDDPWVTVREEGEAIALQNHAPTGKPVTCHWDSWYYQYFYFTEQDLDDFLKGIKRLPDNAGIEAVMVDEGYQPHNGDWLLSSHYFPSGLKPAFDKIREAGFKPALWIGPYMVGNRSQLYLDHPDWVLRYRSGEPVKMWQTYGEERVWGLKDEETYVLDVSHPEAFEYMRRVFRTFREWGVRLYKIDFLNWNNHDSSIVNRYTPGKTSLEYQDEFFKMIRSEIGDDTFMIYCISQFTPFIGYADAMRVGYDTSADWNSHQSMIDEMVGCLPFDQIWWHTDTDAIHLRHYHTLLDDTQVRTLAYWMGLTGSAIYTSDLLYELPPERQALWDFVRPNKVKDPVRLPFWGTKQPFEVVQKYFAKKDAWAVLFINRNPKLQAKRYSIMDLIGEKQCYGWEWSPENAISIGMVEQVYIELAPYDSILYYFCKSNIPPGSLNLGGIELV